MMAGVSMFGVGGSVCNVTPQEKFCSTFTKQTSLRLSVTDGKSSGLNDERIPLTADRSTFYPSWQNSTEKVKVMLPVPDRVANNFTLNAPSKITAYRIFGRARADIWISDQTPVRYLKRSIIPLSNRSIVRCLKIRRKFQKAPKDCVR